LHLAPDRVEVVEAHLVIKLGHPPGFFARELERLDGLDPSFPIGEAGGVVAPLGLIDANLFPPARRGLDQHFDSSFILHL